MSMKISRRQVLRGMGALGVWGAVGRAGAAQKATAFALIGDRYHNSDYIRVGLGKTLGKDLGLSIDFCDEVKMLGNEQLAGRRLLIILRDGMLWPGGYGGQESSNAGYVATGRPKIVSEPSVPPSDGKPLYWITAEQGRAVRSSRRAEAGCCSCIT